MLRRLGRSAVLALTAVVVLVGTASAAPFPARVNLPDGWQPEGITSQGTTLYVGSLANGAIFRANARTGAGAPLYAGAAGESTAGVDVDEANGRLWAVGAGTGTVRVHDIRTGNVLREYVVPPPVGFLNDVAVTNRAVYVTDSNVQQLIVFPLGPGGSLPAAPTKLPITGDMQFVANQFNANGIVATRGWLIVVQSVTGQLFRVNPRTGVSREITTNTSPLVAGDGLELRGSTLYVVRNTNVVAVLKLGPRLLSARFLGNVTAAGLDVSTTGTFAGGRLWIVSARFGTPPTPETPYSVTRVPAHP
ncbi:MAG: superoxide dismutase [Chloroflexota bacterium]